MTSANRDLLKEVMRLELQKKHNQFLRRAYGAQHRITKQHCMQVVQAAAREQARYSQVAVTQVAANVVREREHIKKELQRARALQKAADVDGVLDSLMELKDTVEDVCETFVDSVANTCEVDLVGEDSN
ncbi:tegument protein UL14 [Mandrillus leucophaeus cytomegalovirus]|uniref:Tegument protein UL14 n=1 Tax=Mandrillus leucophaeus cytomegalovirus TaxID=1654930 RepID=A0A0G2UI28_9BETA|nr:tegument protein UL14 [Mandrillus leucophaeus cytomegalovirus]AKI29754.1 tegument protein UL14 [Mandrillus leucophaeus cytomegalovirus]